MQTLRRSATLFVIGAIGLVLVTFACHRLHFNVATAGFLYMIIVVLVSRMGDLISSILVCLVAVFCLAYVVAPGKYVIRQVVRDSEGAQMAARNGIVEIPD
jgi:hypothetical protein